MKTRPAMNVGCIVLVCLFAVIIDTATAQPNLTPGVWTTLCPEWSLGSGHYSYGLGMDPSNPSILYWGREYAHGVSGPDMGLYKTTDKGATWRKLSGTFDLSAQVEVDPKNSNHLYAAHGVIGVTGFYISNDGGESWSLPSGFWDKANNSVGGWTNDVYWIATDPTDFNHILLSFHSGFEWTGNGGVLESKDGGLTWIRHWPSGLGQGHAIAFLYNPALGIGYRNTWLLMTQGGNGYWRTSDGGSTWQKVSDMWMMHGGGNAYYSKTGILYVTGQQIMRSTDNGLTFTRVGPDGGSNGYCFIMGDGYRLYTRKYYNSDPYITSLESDGFTWKDYNTQKFNSGPFMMAFDPVNRIMYSSCGGTDGVGLLALKVLDSPTSIDHDADISVKNNWKDLNGQSKSIIAMDNNTVSNVNLSNRNFYNLNGKFLGTTEWYNQKSHTQNVLITSKQ